jgi:ABC-type multidrug transport system fused ATPase/permease subunit
MQFPFAFLPMGLAQYSQALVSTKRMLEFFNSDELADYVHKEEAADGTVISMTDADLCWMLEEKKEEDSKDAKSKSAKGKDSKGKSDDKKKAEAKNATDKKGKELPESGEATAGDIALVVVDGKLGEEVKEGESNLVNRSVHTLEGMTFAVKKGQLVAVVGAVGSGKSSLLSGLLGEMHLRQVHTMFPFRFEWLFSLLIFDMVHQLLVTTIFLTPLARWRQ